MRHRASTAALARAASASDTAARVEQQLVKMIPLVIDLDTLLQLQTVFTKHSIYGMCSPSGQRRGRRRFPHRRVNGHYAFLTSEVIAFFAELTGTPIDEAIESWGSRILQVVERRTA